MRQAVSRVGLVRFNPFHEIGGNQSFSLALLNEDTNGVVVTSHYGRESNRVYGKRIVKGKAESSLSEEEEKAIQAAKKR
ncbi:MAG: DUF4446 family protein, partial [Candidatus Pacearchaeota archaeon]|nr:DUF4446 family protein [Candidatus Pacearchaeota archaeon]